MDRDCKAKYVGVVSVLVDKHNLLQHLGHEFCDEDMGIMDGIASDFNAACGALEMKRNGRQRYGIFQKEASDA